MVTSAAVIFHAEKVVALKGMVVPMCSAKKEPSVAAVNGPEPE